jgi:hypothetical protein
MRAFLSYHTRRDVAAQTCPIQDDPENGGGGVDILERDARLVRMYRATGIVKLKAYRRRRFPSKYTGQDITLLAEVDRAHERLSGRATVVQGDAAERGVDRRTAQTGPARPARLPAARGHGAPRLATPYERLKSLRRPPNTWSRTSALRNWTDWRWR